MTTPVAPAERRILFVHAHPDDETVSTGATLAHYAAAGAQVTLVTCTLGEEGLIYVPELAGLAAAEADQLGGYRLVELERACRALGVRDHRILGGAGRYRDSGMMGEPTNANPRAFWQADLDAAAAHLLEVYRELRPQVVVTYDTNGGYGHPDHIQAHRVAMRGAELAAEAGFGPQRVYWSAIPRSVMAAGIEAFAGSGNNPFEGVTDVDQIPFVVPDERIAAAIDGVAHVAAKQAAVAAHATQIPADSWLNTLATAFGGEALGKEYFTLAPGWEGGSTGPVDDFFAGLDLTAA